MIKQFTEIAKAELERVKNQLLFCAKPALSDEALYDANRQINDLAARCLEIEALNAELVKALDSLRHEYVMAVERAVEIMHEKGYMCDPAERMIEAMEYTTKTSEVLEKARGAK